MCVLRVDLLGGRQQPYHPSVQLRIRPSDADARGCPFCGPFSSNRGTYRCEPVADTSCPHDSSNNNPVTRRSYHLTPNTCSVARRSTDRAAVNNSTDNGTNAYQPANSNPNRYYHLSSKRAYQPANSNPNRYYHLSSKRAYRFSADILQHRCHHHTDIPSDTPPFSFPHPARHSIPHLLAHSSRCGRD